MNLLLDTHVALWAITDSPRLSAPARAWITDPESDLWVSAASLWEIAIKHALRPSHMPIPAAQARVHFQDSGYRILPIEPEHVLALEGLPTLHADPFDRLLIAQAQAEPMRLLTADARVARYGEAVIRV